jgi:hypothetical protein
VSATAADATAAVPEPARTAEAAEMLPFETEGGTADEEFRPATDEGARKRRALRRKAKRAPEQTKDDTDEGWGEYGDGSAHDRWLHEQRPPHWGQD